MTNLDRVCVRRACLAIEKHARAIIRDNLGQLTCDWSRSMAEVYRYAGLELEKMMEDYKARKLFYNYRILFQEKIDKSRPAWRIEFVFIKGHKPISLTIHVERI